MPLRCPSCGRDIQESSRYCPTCGARVDAAQASTVDAVTRMSSPGPSDNAPFIPGTMLAGRYRIVGLLGRGGMGEVYRADDLKLGQTVALKFLPKGLTQQADRLARFHQEVRLAREVSHPNVCRVHDITESGGLHFLSMEYIDGEDLASLLRRIGRLPSDKALEIAHQLCAGLAAAHDRRVLHRDLKPANVLIDGQGRAHLADFGLADLTTERRDTSEIAGTPGYMAPEQWAGGEITTRTDLYALGLVLYEMFTGKRALSVTGVPLGGHDGRDAPPVSPSTHIPDLESAIERVILRCLEPDPARRPPSALAVSAALPGGNRLSAALAAGETPSPDMVAAAGEAGTLSPAIGAMCFAGVLLGLMAMVPLSRHINLIGLTNVELGPHALTERAHVVAQRLGYTDLAGDEAFGYMSNLDYLQHIDEHDRSPNRWQTLAGSQPPALLFWYRQSPLPMIPIGGTNVVTRLNPPITRSGMLSLAVDRAGRLVNLVAVPSAIESSRESREESALDPAVDWTPLFAEAGLPIARFAPAAPRWFPPVFGDTRTAWEGVYPERPDVPIRIEAAAAAGKPVYFEIFASWTRPVNEISQQPGTSGVRIALFMRSIGAPVILIGAALLARHNLRIGRGDRRGAIRLSLFMLAAGFVSNMLAAGDLQVLSRGTTLIMFLPVMVWLLYIALEPVLRRTWPETLIAWSRLLAGGVRDPLVGRDALVGVLVAIAHILILSLHMRVRQWLGDPLSFPIGASTIPFDGMEASSDMLLGGRHALSRIIGSLMSIPAWGVMMLTFFLLAGLFILLRRRSWAIAGLVLVLTGIYVVTHGGWLLAYFPADHFAPSAVDIAWFVAVQTAVVLVAVRFGLLTMLVATFVSLVLTLIPMTFDSSLPYAGSSWLVAATVVVLAAYGWHTALAGRPLFGDLLGK